GHCSYIDAYNRERERQGNDDNLSVKDKSCLCTHMRNFAIWTCGHYAYRLKDTTRRLADGRYALLSTEHVFHDYQYSKEHAISLPKQP
ncbi:MAG: nitronate monooxygenase, partial [Acidiferrobacter sp.]